MSIRHAPSQRTPQLGAVLAAVVAAAAANDAPSRVVGCKSARSLNPAGESSDRADAQTNYAPKEQQ